jgi:hypothetical protein
LLLDENTKRDGGLYLSRHVERSEFSRRHDMPALQLQQEKPQTTEYLPKLQRICNIFYTKLSCS